MQVTIMYRNTFTGGDGWRYYPMTVTIADDCPKCGCKRGKPYYYRFCEDGEWFEVEKWENPCGHIDTYKECFFENMELKKRDEQVRQSNSF